MSFLSLKNRNPETSKMQVKELTNLLVKNINNASPLDFLLNTSIFMETEPKFKW